MRQVSISIFAFLFFTLHLCFGQSTSMDRGIEAGKEGEFHKAIDLFTQALDEDPRNFMGWYFRGLSYQYTGQFKRALADFNVAISINGNDPDAFVQRGLVQERLTLYELAQEDFLKAHGLDTSLAEPLIRFGLIADKLGRYEEACNAYAQVGSMGEKISDQLLDRCTEDPDSNWNSILYLSQTSDSKGYGYSPDEPIMVGEGPHGGPSNQRDYLDLQRDENGLPVTYTRLRSCCAYESENSVFGMALVDEYEITYTNKKGRTKKTKLYLSFYDFEAPLIPKDFFTVQP